MQDAFRSVVRKVLSDTARSGLIGEHHFNIAFKTHAPGVVVPPAVKQRFPDEMSIILQHEFWDLVVTQDGFEVSLNFSRKPERLTVPFDSITGFTDPSVPFGFKLEPRVAEPAASRAPAARTANRRPPPPPPAKPAPAKLPAQPVAAAKSAQRAGKARRARRRSESRLDRRIPQEIAEEPLGEIVNLRRARKRRERERRKPSRIKTASSLAGRGPRDVRAKRTDDGGGQPRRPPDRAPRCRLTLQTRASSNTRLSSPAIAPAFPSRTPSGVGCVASPRDADCRSMRWRLRSTPRAATPICPRPFEFSCSRLRAPHASSGARKATSRSPGSVKPALGRIGWRGARLRPDGGRRGCRERGIGAQFVAPWSSRSGRDRGLCGCGRPTFGRFGLHGSGVFRGGFLRVGFIGRLPLRLARPSSPPPRVRPPSPPLLHRAGALSAPSAALARPPVLDLLLPSIHESLALEPPVEEGALTNVGLERGDAVGLARDRLRGESGGKGADIELTFWRLERIFDVDLALGGGPDQNLRSAADELIASFVSTTSLRRSRSALSVASPRGPRNRHRA